MTPGCGRRALRGVAALCACAALCLAGNSRGDLPAAIVIGDSTANLPSHSGWADPFAEYFDGSRITVLNRAAGGRSARTFFNEGLWNRVLASLKPGDYVLIQFGHNDPGAPDQPPFRADLPGIGDESMKVILPGGKTELVHTFGWYLRKFVRDAECKGAHPVVLSVTVRNSWTNGKVERGLHGGVFSRWSREVAEGENIPFVDATNIIADAYEKMGRKKVVALFLPDCTHTTQAGADLTARLIVAGLKGIHSPLADFLSEKGRLVEAAAVSP
jgi:rhamnogalacturonan acetylesterase